MSCSVFGCTNHQKKTDKQTPKVLYYSFPGREYERDRRQKWITFCKRKLMSGAPWQPTRASKICSHHFYQNKRSQHPLEPGYNPTIFVITDKTEEITERLERSADRSARLMKRRKIQECAADKLQTPPEDLDVTTVQLNRVGRDSVDTLSRRTCIFYWNPVCTFESTRVANVEVQVNTLKPTRKRPKVDKCSQTCEPRAAWFRGIKSLDASTQGYRPLTGLEPSVFAVFLSLLPEGSRRSEELNNQDKLLLFCMKLKLDLSFVSLSVIFGISKSTAARHFYMVLDVLFQTTKGWLIWPSRKAIRATMPESFKQHYPKCRVIIDCTEIKTELPKGVEFQNLMYSNYKSAHTLKYLVGIAPSGLITFVSKGYGGRSTDTQITNACGILELLEPKDVVLADRGFPNIQLKHNSILVMPPFSDKTQKQFTEEQMKDTYNIASVRIHVERAIQRLKVFKITSGRLSTDLFHCADKILQIIALFVNFSAPIIKQGD